MATVLPPSPPASPLDTLTPELLAAARRHPNFRAAVEFHCAGRVRAQAGMDALTLWMTRDIGRYSLASAMVILDGQPGGVTAAALFQAAQASGASSRGRVSQLIEQMQGQGGLTIPPGSGHWTRRRLIVHPKVIDPLTDHVQTWIRSASMVFPELQASFTHFDDRAWLVRYMAIGGLLAAQAQYLIAPSDRPMSLFIGRDGGMAIFCDLFCRQAPDRLRLLEEAPLSRKGLAARTGVSRTQIQRLLSDGEGQGLFTCSRDVVHFTEKMSEDAERHFALTLHLTRIAVSVAPLAERPADADAPPAQAFGGEAPGARPMHISANLAPGGIQR